MHIQQNLMLALKYHWIANKVSAALKCWYYHFNNLTRCTGLYVHHVISRHWLTCSVNLLWLKVTLPPKPQCLVNHIKIWWFIYVNYTFELISSLCKSVMIKASLFLLKKSDQHSVFTSIISRQHRDAAFHMYRTDSEKLH